MATHSKPRRAAPAVAEALVALAAGAAAAAAAARAAGRIAESATLVATGHTLSSVAALLRIGSDDPRVDERLEALQPCLEAQLLAADLGIAAGTSRGLVPDETHMRAVAAKHLFGEDIDISSISAVEVRRRQRRGRMGPRNATDMPALAEAPSAAPPRGVTAARAPAEAPSAAQPRGMAAASALGQQAEAPSAAPPRGMAAASDGDVAEHERWRMQPQPQQQQQQPSSAHQSTQHACDNDALLTPILGRRSIGAQAAACTKAPQCLTALAEAPSAAQPRGVAEACVFAAASSAASPRGTAPADTDKLAPAAAPSAAPLRGQAAADVQLWRVEADGASQAEPRSSIKHAAAPSAALPRSTAATSVSLGMPAPAAASSAASPRGMTAACVFAAAPSAAAQRGPAPADKGTSAPATAPSAAQPRGTAAADVQSWRETAPHSSRQHAEAPSAALSRGTAAAKGQPTTRESPTGGSLGVPQLEKLAPLAPPAAADKGSTGPCLTVAQVAALAARLQAGQDASDALTAVAGAGRLKGHSANRGKEERAAHI